MGKVAVIGAGSWASALSRVLATNRHEVVMYTRREEQKEEINLHHTNRRYLPEMILPDAVSARTNLSEVISGAFAVLFVVPSHAVREVARQSASLIPKNTLVIHAVKGLEMGSMKRISSVIEEELARRQPVVVLSGPSHAEEVALALPATVVVSCTDLKLAEQAQELLMTHYFRVYINPDVLGTEIAGALKNVIALAAGISDGLSCGDNAKAALMTRGLAEITRLGTAMGADAATFSGLAGIGDLVVTCTSHHSRNWRAGYQLAQGSKLEEVLQKMGMVVEGVKTTEVAYHLSRQYKVEMPITQELYRVLFEGVSPGEAVDRLMGRARKHEVEDRE